MTDLERIAHELRTANLIAFMKTIDTKSSQYKALHKAIVAAFGDQP